MTRKGFTSSMNAEPQDGQARVYCHACRVNWTCVAENIAASVRFSCEPCVNKRANPSQKQLVKELKKRVPVRVEDTALTKFRRIFRGN